MINNTYEYLSLQRRRALGDLPDMGCAIRVMNLINERIQISHDQKIGLDILDVGCAAGHFYRSFIRRGMNISTYTGIEIDSDMVNSAKDVWSNEIAEGKVSFINENIEQFSGDRKFGYVICVNAFMYFASAETALRKMMSMTQNYLIIRSYFTDANYRIIRAQTNKNHDKSNLDEVNVFDAQGNMLCYDFWNIYSQSYIQSVIIKIDPCAEISWIEDKNVVSSIEEESKLSLHKRGATEIFSGHEISYPFFLPWKYLVISFQN